MSVLSRMKFHEASISLCKTDFIHCISFPFQLLDLGFEEEQIVDALLKHDNDRDKALEELIA